MQIHPEMNDQNKIEAVVFDLGNVVLEWDVEKLLRSMDVSEVERDLLRNELFSHQDWVELDRGTKRETAVAADVCTRTNLTTEIVEKALKAAKTSLALITETYDLMSEIRESGRKLYCLSNMSPETYEYVRGREFFGVFSGVVISGLEKCVKPEKKIFKLLIERFDLEPEKTLFIDDSLVNIEAARRLGFSGFHFKRSLKCYSRIRHILFGGSADMPIRLATKHDAQSIHDLHTESVNGLCNLYSEEIIAGWLKGRTPEGYKGIARNEMYVYELDGMIAGFSHVVPGEIIAMFVSPEHARKGIGTKLMKHAIPLAKKGWEGPIMIKATLNAVPFYESLGFEKVGDSVSPRNGIEIPIAIMNSVADTE